MSQFAFIGFLIFSTRLLAWPDIPLVPPSLQNEFNLDGLRLDLSGIEAPMFMPAADELSEEAGETWQSFIDFFRNEVLRPRNYSRAYMNHFLSWAQNYTMRLHPWMNRETSRNFIYEVYLRTVFGAYPDILENN